MESTGGLRASAQREPDASQGHGVRLGRKDLEEGASRSRLLPPPQFNTRRVALRFRIEFHMPVVFLIAAALVLVGVVAQVNVVLALLVFMLAAISVPALVMHRREMAYGPEIGTESEGLHHGLSRLAGILAVDLTGIATGVLIIALAVAVARLLAPHLG